MFSFVRNLAKRGLAKGASLSYAKKCPVCGNRVKAFLPIPEIFLTSPEKYNFPYNADQGETLNYKEYSCPYCGASDRDRLYALYLQEHINPVKQYKLLDIAPARALRDFLKKKKNVAYRSADLMSEDVDDSGVDITDMNNYATGAFDIFICSHVLEHVVDDRKAMRELRRVLKKDGFGIAMVPIVLGLDKIDEDPGLTDIAERWRRFGQDDHVRLYSREAFTGRLKESGFQVNEMTIREFGESAFLTHGISPASVLYIVN